MGNFLNNAQKLVDSITIMAYFLPIIWVFLIQSEWTMLNKYYRTFYIDHSFKTDYKIAFNPRYVWSLLAATINMSIIYGFAQIHLSCIVFLSTFYLGFGLYLLKEKRKLAKDLKMLLNSNNKKNDDQTVEKKYRNTKKRWTYIFQFHRISMNLFYMCFIGVAVLANDLNVFSIPTEAIIYLKTNTLPILDSIGGIRPIAYFIWLLISTLLMNKLFVFALNPQMVFYDSFDYVRVITVDEKTYAILAPTNIDSNSVCIAVRTIICRKKNGISLAYLIRDDAISNKVPYEGQYYLVNVNNVVRISPKKEHPTFLTNSDLKVIMTEDKVDEYMKYDRSWAPINELKPN